MSNMDPDDRMDIEIADNLERYTMRGDKIKAECEALGLNVERVPASGFVRAFNARGERVRVIWTQSDISDRLVGGVTLMINGRETFARSIREIRFLVESRK